MAASKWALGFASASLLLVAAAPDAKAASTISFKGGSTNMDFGAFNGPAQSSPNVAAAYCTTNVDTSPCATGASGLFSGYNAFSAQNGNGTYVNALFVAITAGATASGGSAEWYGKDVTASLGTFKIFGGSSGDIFVSAITPTFSGIGITKLQGGNYARSFEGDARVKVSGYFGERLGTVSFKSLLTYYTDPTGGSPVTYSADGFTTLTLDEVPSPLPILGAASAFGFTRRLRKRIALAAK
ncbi:MAG: hypothetical protein VKO65_09070 [Cyanobacteriota bacterium]|nr:hypothetical protein [Cyanobacteriota bacterium]